MSNAVMDMIFQEVRLSSISSFSPDSMNTFNSPNDFASFYLLNSSKAGRSMAFVNSIIRSLAWSWARYSNELSDQEQFASGTHRTSLSESKRSRLLNRVSHPAPSPRPATVRPDDARPSTISNCGMHLPYSLDDASRRRPDGTIISKHLHRRPPRRQALPKRKRKPTRQSRAGIHHHHAQRRRGGAWSVEKITPSRQPRTSALL